MLLIEVFGIPDVSNLPNLDTDLTEKVNGGGNSVFIVQSANTRQVLNGRIKCVCRISGSVAFGSEELLQQQITEILKKHLKVNSLDVSFFLAEPRCSFASVK